MNCCSSWEFAYHHVRYASTCPRGRPNASLGPGIPDPPVELPVTSHKDRHRIPGLLKVVARPFLGGLHQEYGLLAKAA